MATRTGRGNQVKVKVKVVPGTLFQRSPVRTYMNYREKGPGNLFPGPNVELLPLRRQP